MGSVTAPARRRTRRTSRAFWSVWIAAHAMETGADLVSFDRHFAHVQGLAWVFPSP